MPKDAHDAHLKIDRELWDRASRAAIITGKSMTAVVEEGIAMWLRSYEDGEDMFGQGER